MSVTSIEFFAFALLICGALKLLGSSDRHKKLLLIGASLYFYSTYDLRFVAILAYLTILSDGVGRGIAQAAPGRARTCWLWTGLVLGLLPLFTYKYLPAIAVGRAASFDPAGLGARLSELVLPIGISFYTFQALSYPLDVYRGTIRQPAKFIDIACFITFFPKLLVGPIARAGQFLPQLQAPIRLADGEAAGTAVWLVVQGLLKKLVFADVLAAQFVDPAFADPHAYGSLFLALAVLAYSFQLYFDLSGYTDIVRGVSRLMGFELPVNFNRPYLATSVSNFWQRWHISMSSFFRDYLYFSIGGSKHGNVYFNLIVTFVAIGIWHGAGWNFVLYGLIHGSLVAVERARRGGRRAQGATEPPLQGADLALRICQTFLIVAWARVLFRADSLQSSIDYLAALRNVGDLSVPASALGNALLLAAALAHFTPPAWTGRLHQRLAGLPATVQVGGIATATTLCLMLGIAGASFIYAQF